MQFTQSMKAKMNSLVIFRSLLEDEVLEAFKNLIEGFNTSEEEMISNYSYFLSKLFPFNSNFSQHLLDIVLSNENFYVMGKAKGKEFDEAIEGWLEEELKILKDISLFTSDNAKAFMKFRHKLPAWQNSDIDFVKAYRDKIDSISTSGYGMYSKFHFFTLDQGKLIPIKHPDTIKLSELKEYDKERDLVARNTLSLIEGRPASNVLLYGDAGTGKSSTVKAIVNEYKEKGLRLIEIKKDQLSYLPEVIEEINDICLKFILFIDDLSFSQNSDDFGALKAILEGSVMAVPDNAAIYATSNRRHLIKENFSDRLGDDVHVNETLQEISSLSERFGLTVFFEKPNREKYLEIVEAIAAEKNLNIKTEDLRAHAERYALNRSGRSPRMAQQLVDHLLGHGELP